MLARIAISVDSGVEVWSYNEKNSLYTLLDPQLIAGFMTAIQNFSESVIKSTIQEIHFADLYLYIRSYGTFSLYLFLKSNLPNNELEYYFSEISKTTLPLLADQSIGVFPHPSVFNEKILPLVAPLLHEEVQKEAKEKLKAIKKPIVKIALIGLAKAGKTTMFEKFFKKSDLNELKNIKPTINMVQHVDFEEFINENIMVKDFGGQEVYRKLYLKEIDHWKDLSSLIFVIDLQSPASFLPSLDYLNQIWEVIEKENTSKINLSIFLHKYDPNKRRNLNKNVKIVLETFKDYLEIGTFYLTSIKDISSNIALIQTLYFSLPDVMLQKLLDDELLEYFERTIIPSYAVNVAQEKDILSILPSFQQVVTNLGTEYAVLLQKAWLNVIRGSWTPKPRNLSSRTFLIERKHQSIELTLENWTRDGVPAMLTNKLLTSFLDGVLKTLHFETPTIIVEEPRYTTWKIRF